MSRSRFNSAWVFTRALDNDRAERLGNIVDGTGLKAENLFLFASIAGNENDRNPGGSAVGLEAPAHLKAVDAGHDDIQQDQVRRLVGMGDGQGPFTLGGDAERVRVFEKFHQHPDIARLVIHDQDGGLIHAGSAMGVPFPEPSEPAANSATIAAACSKSKTDR